MELSHYRDNHRRYSQSRVHAPLWHTVCTSHVLGAGLVSATNGHAGCALLDSKPKAVTPRGFPVEPSERLGTSATSKLEFLCLKCHLERSHEVLIKVLKQY